MTADGWRTVVAMFVAAVFAVFAFALAEHAVDARRPRCGVRLASDRSWTPVGWNDGLPPAGCRIVVTQVQEAK